MAANLIEELREFHRFLTAKLTTDVVALSPEEALDEWRRLHPQIQAGEDLTAIREALDDMANGDRGIPFDEFNREFRERHGLPS